MVSLGSNACRHGIQPIALGKLGCHQLRIVYRLYVVLYRRPQALHGVAIDIVTELPEFFFHRHILHLVLYDRQRATQRIDVFVGGADGNGGSQFLHIFLHAFEELLTTTHGQERECQVIAGEVDILSKVHGSLLIG